MSAASRLALCVVLGVLVVAAAAQAKEIHVAVDKPLAPEVDWHVTDTIQAAVDLAQPGDVVLVHPGIYRETVTFARSGTADAPITVRAADPGVIISGCEPIDGWTEHKPGVWKAAMPWTLGLGRNQCFDADGVLIEARFPNVPADGLGMYVADLSPLWPTFGEFSIPKETMEKQPGRIVSKLLDGEPDDYWKGACYYGLHYEAWSAQTGTIESSRSGEITVGDRTRTWWFGPAFGGKYSPEEGRGMIVGHMNALDAPTEWHWQDGMLYLIPRKPGRPTGIQAKRRQVALDLSGRSHIRIEGLKVVGASMRLDGSSFCSVDRCDLSYISHFTRFYDIGQVEDGKNTITSGETGIFVGGHDNSFTNCSVRFSAGAGFYLRGYHHTIHNCLIDEIDYTSHYLNAITDAVSDYGQYENTLIGGHVITFNTMRNAGRHFFNFNGNGTSTASRDRKPMDYMATLFAHNHLYNGMLQTRDAGFLTGYFSSGGTLNGLRAQVAYNVLHDNYDIAGMKWGSIGMLYLDQGTSDVEVHHNLLWAAPGSHQRGMWFNTACVNIAEHDNVFWPMFAMTCDRLQDDDFPGRTPFRFGHDFDDAPQVPAWPPLLAHRYTPEQLASSPSVSRTDTALGNLRDGDWVRLDDVDWKQPWQTALMSFASGNQAINSNHDGRQQPRHLKRTDPLVLEVDANDGLSEGIQRLWTLAYDIKDGQWVRFKQVPLGDGYGRLRIVYGCDKPGARRAELRLDSPDGELVSTVRLEQTDTVRGDRVQINADGLAPVAAQAKGTHDLYLVFRGGDGGPVADVEYARLEQYRGSLPLAPSEVKVELRTGSPDGAKIGEFYPRPSGGDGRFITLVAKLETAQAGGPLYAVVRSAAEGSIGIIGDLALQRSTWSGGAIAGVGIPPRTDASGNPKYPKPTNVPIARPADKYAASLDRTRPVILAEKADVAGKDPSKWPNALPLTLAESYTGQPTDAVHSTARVAYDDQALYVAIENPLRDVTGLPPSSHEWGRSDGVEIAIQDGLSATPGPVLDLRGYPDGHFQASTDAGAPQEALDRLAAATTYQAVASDAGWNCTWRIPFDALGITPAGTPRLLFNIGVYKKSQSAWVVLRGTGAANYRVAKGTTLVFAEAFVSGFALPTESMVTWLDASDPASIVRDDAGRVSIWRDKSGTNHNGTQTDAGHRPTFAPTALDGLPAIVFDYTRQTYMNVPDISSGKVKATIFAVVANREQNAPENHDQRIFTASDGKDYDYIVGLACTVPGTGTGGPRVIQTSAEDAWAKFVRVGCFSPQNQTYFHGQISEIIVYTDQLAPRQVGDIQDYLSVKWRLR